MMNQFFCSFCSRTSFLDERFCCIHCGNGLGGPWIVFADNLHLPQLQLDYAIPGCYVPVTNSGNQNFMECLKLVKPTREASTQTSDDDLHLQVAGRNGDENCPKRERHSQNKTSHDLDWYNNENENRLQVNSKANEGEAGCAAALMEVSYDKAANFQQTYLSEESSFTEGENRNYDELFRRQRYKEPTERGMKFDSFAFKGSITPELSVNLPSCSSDQVEDRQDNIPPTFYFHPRLTSSVNNCFQANKMAQQNPETSGKLSKRRCGDCGRIFFKEWTFKFHKDGYCGNKRKPYKCGECGEIFREIIGLISHERTHAGEKQFKCTQCDYAYATPYGLKNHMKSHTNK